MEQIVPTSPTPMLHHQWLSSGSKCIFLVNCSYCMTEQVSMTEQIYVVWLSYWLGKSLWSNQPTLLKSTLPNHNPLNKNPRTICPPLSGICVYMLQKGSCAARDVVDTNVAMSACYVVQILYHCQRQAWRKCLLEHHHDSGNNNWPVLRLMPNTHLMYCILVMLLLYSI